MADNETIMVRIRLQDAHRFQADAIASAAAVKGIGAAGETASVGLGNANRQGAIMRQGLYTLRRAAFAATVTLAGIGTGAVLMGIKFNSSMEQNRVSLGYFLGSTKAANRELSYLYEVAAKTPFEFGQITDAAKRFLAFGFTLKQTNSYLATLGDTAAGLGLGGADVARLAIILGQIKSSGRLLGQDTLQLAQAGIDARGILKKQFNLSKAQMAALGAGNLSIPADVAIPAIMRGLQERFKGMAALQANTGAGLFSTAKDYGRMLVGGLTGSLFEKGKSNLRSLNKILGDMNHVLQPKFMKGLGGSFTDALTVLDKDIGANGRLLTAFHQLAAAGQALWNILKVGFGVLKIVFGIIGPGSILFGILAGTLGLVGRHTTLLKIALGLLAARFLYLRTATLIYRVAERLTAKSTAEMTATTKLMTVWSLRGAFAQYAAAKATALWGVGLKLLTAALRITRAAAIATWIAALGPIGLIILGVGALVGVLVGLYYKWGWFHDKVDATFHWIQGHWPLLLAIITGPFGLAALAIIRHFNTIKNAARGALNFLINGWNSLHFKIPGFKLGPIHFGGVDVGVPKIPLLALGGTVVTPGTVMVGERGPELLSLPRGATVQPLAPIGSTGAGYDGLITALVAALERITVASAPVVMDGREVAEVVFRARARRLATT